MTPPRAIETTAISTMRNIPPGSLTISPAAVFISSMIVSDDADVLDDAQFLSSNLAKGNTRLSKTWLSHMSDCFGQPSIFDVSASPL